MAIGESRQLHLRLTADLKHCAQVRERLEGFLASHHVMPAVRDDLVLAIDEALTNAAWHSCQGRPDAAIELGLVLEVPAPATPATLAGAAGAAGAGSLTVTLVDWGDPQVRFNPARALVHNQELAASGKPAGFGLGLIHRLMDRVDYSRREDGTHCLTMNKQLTLADDAGMTERKGTDIASDCLGGPRPDGPRYAQERALH